MAVEGFSRVNKEQGAGTGEAFMLGESKALTTYVDQEKEQIAEKKKADKEVVDFKVGDIGYEFIPNVQNMFSDYRNKVLEIQNAGGDLQSSELKRLKGEIEDAARNSMTYSARLKAIQDGNPQELFGAENAKYIDKSIVTQEINQKLRNTDGTIKNVNEINPADMQDLFFPSAFNTTLFVDDSIKNIKDAFIDQTTGMVRQGYGEYIQTDGNKIRFINGYDAQGNPIAGVSDNVTQLLLKNPAYNAVTSKLADAEIEQFVQQEIANGTDEAKARQMGQLQKEARMKRIVAKDVEAYQQVETEAEQKLAINVKATDIDQQEANIKQQELNLDKDKFKFDKGKWEKENEAAVNTDPNYRQTDIKTTSGGNATVIQLGSVQLPKGSKGADGQGLPLDLILNNIIYTDNQNTTEAVGEDGGEMTVNGKTVKNGSIKAQELTGNQTVTIIPNDLGNQIVNDDGSIAAWSNTEGTKFDDLNNAAQKEGKQVQLFMNGWEIKKDREGKIISKRPVQVPLQGNDQAKILKTFGFNQREEAEQALDGGRNLNYTKNASPKTFRTKEEQTKAEKEKEAARGTSVLSGGTTSTNTSSSSNNTYNYLDQE